MIGSAIKLFVGLLLLTVTKAALTKTDLADHLFEKLGAPRSDAKVFVESFFTEITNSLAHGEKVKLTDFGAFYLRNKSERPGKNPITGEDISISARRVVLFKPDQKLKDRVGNYKETDGESRVGHLLGRLMDLLEDEISMTNYEIVGNLAKQFQLYSLKEIDAAVKDILEVMSSNLAQIERIEIGGFGSFPLYYREAKTERNPKTGVVVKLDARFIPHFKPGQKLRKAVNFGKDY